MTGRPLVADPFFAFLPHRVKPSAGPAVALDDTAMNPGFLTKTGVTRNAALQAIVDRRVLEKSVASPVNPDMRKLRFALVDLTGAAKLRAPQFAGHEETTQGGIGSMAKLACAYASFQLKFDLEELSRQKSLTTEKDLFAAARTAWGDTQNRDTANRSTLFASKPKIELFGKLIEIDSKKVQLPASVGSPDLEKMFTATAATGAGASGMKLRFKGSDKILVDPSAGGSPPHVTDPVKRYLAAGGESLREVRKLSFAERLFLMIDDSDNAASHSCIENVSFLYIASALWQSSIYSPDRGGGLWEASTHDTGGVRWIKAPVPQGAPGNDFVSATAASAAALITLIEQGRLVNSEASAGMRHLMDKSKSISNGSFTRSFFAEGLDHLTLDRLHSKLGIGNFNNDGAIIVRTIPAAAGGPAVDTAIRYVAAGFDDPLSEDGAKLRKLIRLLDKCILENNGLITAATP